MVKIALRNPFRPRKAAPPQRTYASAPNIPGLSPTVFIGTVRTAGVNGNALIVPSSLVHVPRDELRHAEASDKLMTAASTIGAVVKDVGEALDGVPIVKAVAGLVVTAVNIADECQVCKDAAEELAERLENTTAEIIRLVTEIAPRTKNMDPARRTRILQALEEYFRLVRAIEQKLVSLKRYTKWNRLLLRRTALLRQFGQYERELDQAAQNFQRDLLCGIATDVAIVNQSIQEQGLRSTVAEIAAFFFRSPPALSAGFDLQLSLISVLCSGHGNGPVNL